MLLADATELSNSHCFLSLGVWERATGWPHIHTRTQHTQRTAASCLVRSSPFTVNDTQSHSAPHRPHTELIETSLHSGAWPIARPIQLLFSVWILTSAFRCLDFNICCTTLFGMAYVYRNRVDNRICGEMLKRQQQQQQLLLITLIIMVIIISCY